MGEWQGPAGSDLFFCDLACLALVGGTFFLQQPYPILDYGSLCWPSTSASSLLPGGPKLILPKT